MKPGGVRSRRSDGVRENEQLPGVGEVSGELSMVGNRQPRKQRGGTARQVATGAAGHGSAPAGSLRTCPVSSATTLPARLRATNAVLHGSGSPRVRQR